MPLFVGAAPSSPDNDSSGASKPRKYRGFPARVVEDLEKFVAKHGHEFGTTSLTQWMLRAFDGQRRRDEEALLRRRMVEVNPGLDNDGGGPRWPDPP